MTAISADTSNANIVFIRGAKMKRMSRKIRKIKAKILYDLIMDVS